MSEVAAVGLLAHLAATLAMTGLIWFVQLVHYPLFALVGANQFATYEHDHVKRTGWVVGPLMLVEAGTAPLLLFAVPGLNAVAWGSLILLALIWLSTAAVQVPLHRRLQVGWDAAAGHRLVRSNWIRTLAWTARSVLLFVLLATNLRTI